MSRKKYGVTEHRILKFLKEGRGQGTGAKYKPWTLVSDLSSKGRSHRVYWWKTDRVHHFLSDTEFLVFVFLVWADVEDIREQYPLPRRETVRIAKALGVKHPVDPNSRALWVMTTDFVVTVMTPQGLSIFAIAVKPEQALERVSVLNKLEIERVYWEEQRISWYLITDAQVKNRVGMNLWWIFDGSEKPDPNNGLVLCVFSLLAKERGIHPHVPIKEICKAIDHQLSVPRGTALGALRRLLAWKWVTVDLNTMHLQDLPISEFSFAGGPKHAHTVDSDC